METKRMQEMIQSKQFRKILIGIGGIVIFLLVFSAGMQVGYMKASFSFRYGDNYYRSFGPETGHAARIVMPLEVSGAHGVAGRIVSIELPTMIVADRDNTERVVRINPQTVLRSFRDTIMPADLKPGDMIVVLGAPNEATEIEAKLVRVMPDPHDVPLLPPAETLDVQQ